MRVYKADSRVCTRHTIRRAHPRLFLISGTRIERDADRCARSVVRDATEWYSYELINNGWERGRMRPGRQCPWVIIYYVAYELRRPQCQPSARMRATIVRMRDATVRMRAPVRDERPLPHTAVSLLFVTAEFGSSS